MGTEPAGTLTLEISSLQNHKEQIFLYLFEYNVLQHLELKHTFIGNFLIFFSVCSKVVCRWLQR